MSQKTGIEWCDATWNPIRGCSRVSEGCRNCYAERMAARFSRCQCDKNPANPVEANPDPFHGFARMTPSGPRWTGRVELIESQLEVPLHWRKPLRIFVNSMSDTFHGALPEGAIDRVFAVMALCPQHTFMVLTKRPGRMEQYFREKGGHFICEYAHNPARTASRILPFQNVWLGVSVEDRKNKQRIDALRETPAALRFLSLEPLLEDLGELDLRGIDWVIAGGESGPGARPAHPSWFRSVRDQCVEDGVTFFFKQWGEWEPYNGRANGADRAFLADGTQVMRVGKKAAGRLLDGREWNQMPEVRR